MENTFKSGTRPNRNAYSCTNCHAQVNLDENGELPLCPNCTNIEFTEEY